MNILTPIPHVLRTAVMLVILLMAGSACTTGNQDALGVGAKPAAETTTAEQQQNPGQTALAGTGETTPAASATVVAADGDAATTSARVSFLPITGAPQHAVSTLSKALGTESTKNNIILASADDQTSKYRMKGYLSALNEGSSTTVTFYWDVLDAGGRRLYRINGFEREGKASGDPWAAVSSATMHNIAVRTMSNLAGWIKRKG